MSQTSLNLTAITIFSFVLLSLVGPLVHLSPTVPAIAAFGLLGLATVDTLGWQGKGATLLLDWLANFSPEHRDRVLHHEAGHFLTAHLLNLPITGYTLSAWDAFRQGQPGQGGVVVDSQELDAELEQGRLSDQLIDRYCTVWMAGIAAEQLTYGNVEGGNGDRQTLRILWSQLRRSPTEAELKERWGILQAKTLIQSHQPTYEKLVQAMRENTPVEECRQLIEHSLETA
ncbi:ATP-dependent Zn protease [Oscillatoria sp. FACHB-1407]|uniref:ATP-dependent Zn protease n=1 Tax=Oscillatoria sp. FACHB-1407 TaxID=2692847 RepID=UPI001683A99B|nr:ATP-dependent Zn protease [Oscillatoria sp. FACHB-1407]